VGAMVLQKKASISDIYMITAYLWMFWWPIQELISSTNKMQKHYRNYKDLKEYIYNGEKFVDGNKELVFAGGTIDFVDIDF
jgi:hypothetical protein